MKLSQWAKKQGIHYQTAYKWFCNGKLPVKAIQLDTGTILVENEEIIKKDSDKVWIYARVSSNQQKKDLERQIERCIKFAETKGWQIQKVYKEIASGMNDNRKQLMKLLNENPTRILIEHKDRLTRFGFNYFDVLLPKLNCELIVINRDKEEKDDLLKDLVAIITSFCCRLYGLRKGKNKSNKIKKELK